MTVDTNRHTVHCYGTTSSPTGSALMERGKNRMKLTIEEQKICDEYRKRDENNTVHCFECPLVVDRIACVCKANLTKKEYRKWKGEENE